MRISLIASSNKANTDTYLAEYQCGCYQDIGLKESQEDALCIAPLQMADLIPYNEEKILPPSKIGYRLWTCHLQMHQAICNNKHTSGSTATSTVYDGKQHLITATLGDSVCFAAVYDPNGTLLGVRRLNSRIHHPTVQREACRVSLANATIKNNRVAGTLSMTRAIGDNKVKYRTPFNNKTPISSESQIDIIDINDLPEYTPSSIVLLIACSDGFTDGNRGDISKIGQEEYLSNQLLNITNAITLPENELAKELVKGALKLSFFDNVSVAIQRLKPSQPFFIGLYDGHSGPNAATYLAKNMLHHFIKLATLSFEEYGQEPFSVYQKEYGYRYDIDHNQTIEQCEDKVFSTLYMNDLLTEANINLLTPYSKSEKAALLNALYNIGLHLFNEVDSLTRQSVLDIKPVYVKAFDSLITLFKSNNWLNKQSLVCLIKNEHQDTLYAYLLRRSQKPLKWIKSTNLPLLLDNNRCLDLINTLKCLENHNVLTDTFAEALIEHQQISNFYRILGTLNKYNLITRRNITIMMKRKNLLSDLNFMTIDTVYQIISWEGAILYKEDIDINNYFKHLPANEIHSLMDFKERLTEISDLTTLNDCVQTIKTSKEFEALKPKETTFTFWSNTSAIDVFNTMVKQQEVIINNLKIIRSGPAYQKN